LLSWKQNAPGLNSRKVRISLRDLHLGFHDFIYCTHPCRICALVSIGKLPHGHVKGSLGKSLSLYSPMGAWFVISLVMHAHNELEKPKYFSQAPP